MEEKCRVAPAEILTSHSGSLPRPENLIEAGLGFAELETAAGRLIMARRRRKNAAEGHNQGRDEPLVDRELERELLRGHLRGVVQGGVGRAVVLLGESGIGKTMLARGVIAEAREAGMRVIAAQCVGRGAEPLLPLKEHRADHARRGLPGRIR